MKLASALGLSESREIAAFVGGGGKTTALFRLARELACCGRQVLVTTTTKMYVPPAGTCPTVLCAEPTCLGHLFASSRIVATGAGILPGNKLAGLPSQAVDNLQASGVAEYILVEADGSKGLPLKAPGPHEPVIPRSATMVVIVAGLDGLGKKLNRGNVHRPEIAAAILKREQGSILDERAIAGLLTHSQGIAGRVPPGVRTVFLLNKLDVVDRGRALNLARMLVERGAERVIMGSVGMEKMNLQVLMP